MSDGHHKLPPKKEVALALLEGPSMFVHLDPRRSGVLVPKRFLAKPQLVLQIGLNMFIPITDLKVDDEGITCTLSFDRAPFWCRMPWNAIYALVGEDGRGMMWPTDIPPEVVAQMQSPPPQKDPNAGKAPPKKQRARLAAVEEPPAEEMPEAEEADPIAEEKPSAGATVRTLTRREEPRVDDEAREETRENEPTAEPRPQPSAASGRKPKRELPPYLRVIK